MDEMKISCRLKVVGTIGFILLIVGAVFSHVPIIALLTLPIFALGIVISAVFLFSLSDEQVSNRKKWFGAFFIIAGIVGFSFALYLAAWHYANYLVAVSRDVVDRFYPAPWRNILTILALNIVTSSVAVLGVRQRSKWKVRKLFLLWLALLLAIPLTLVLVKLWEILGFPLTA